MDGFELFANFGKIKMKEVPILNEVREKLVELVEQNAIIQEWCHQINCDAMKHFNRMNNALLR